MKRIALALVVAALAFAAWTAPAHADTITTTIADDYVGGVVSTKTTSGSTPVSSSHAAYQVDTVGSASKYSVYGMTVTYSGGTLTVAIESSYFDNVGSDGTTMGDLFISSDGWDMGSQTAPYKTDTQATGEDWEYVLVLDNRLGTTSGTVTLYKVSDGTIVLTTAPTGTVFRAEQEATFTPGSGATALATGTWSITNNSGDHDFLTFSIALSGAGYSLFADGSDGLGFHWAMSCGNDTIEGFAPVPEPATALLVATGVAGYGVYRARRRGAPVA